jgi:hypothetical protein
MTPMMGGLRFEYELPSIPERIMSRFNVHFILGSWPRDGILRVEIMKNPPEYYTVEMSYEKERNLQLLQRQNEELFLTMFSVFSVDR